MINKSRLPIINIIFIGLLPGFLKKFYYRIKGYKIGKHVKFSWGSTIIATGECVIKKHSSFGFFTIVSCRDLFVGNGCEIRSLVIIKANNISMGDDVIISETAIIRAAHLSDKSNLIIEDRVHIFPKTILDPSFPIKLGEECAVGFYSNLYTHGSYKSILDGYKVIYGPITIGKRVELAYSVFVAPDVTIGDDAIIAHGSYVNKNLPAGVLAAGSPVVVKREKMNFAPTPSEEGKITIISKIINEFCEHLIYHKSIKSYLKENNKWILTGIKIQTIQFCFSSTEDVQLNLTDVFVIYKNSFDGIIKNTNNVIDIGNLQCGENLCEIAAELKDFFDRYGIRFHTMYK